MATKFNLDERDTIKGYSIGLILKKFNELDLLAAGDAVMESKFYTAGERQLTRYGQRVVEFFCKTLMLKKNYHLNLFSRERIEAFIKDVREEIEFFE